jgi:hypothetical protein
MEPQMTQNRRFTACLDGIVAALLMVTTSRAVDIPVPRNSDLSEFLGQPMPRPIERTTWATSEPPQTNLIIYAVQPPNYDSNRLEALANFVGAPGEPARMPDYLDIAPGYWIKCPNPTNNLLWRSVFFSERTGALGYGSGDNGYRWDLKNRQPLVRGVPSYQEAMRRAFGLLPVLGLTTNDLELSPDGSIRRQFSKDVTGYNEIGSKERKEVVQKRTAIFFQRVPGGETISVGEGGSLQVSFVSEGKISDIDFLFRDLRPSGYASPMLSKDIVRALRQAKAWTFGQALPEFLTITNCTVAYPQGNSSYRQRFVWPVYRVVGFGRVEGQTNAFSFFIPLTPR